MGTKSRVKAPPEYFCKTWSVSQNIIYEWYAFHEAPHLNVKYKYFQMITGLQLNGFLKNSHQSLPQSRVLHEHVPHEGGWFSV